MVENVNDRENHCTSLNLNRISLDDQENFSTDKDSNDQLFKISFNL